jgi:hypothetical protein
MEVEEIEALWDQFTCLASTEWESDPNKVGWALDRRAFNYAFVPRYNGFVAVPNLIYDRIFTYYDTDKNGLIGFEEWIKGIDGIHTTDMKVKARIIFNGYDIDGDGYISRKDVLRVFRAYYTIEKEATRNFVAELTEELSVRNGLDTIRSSQPLGSAFPPNILPSSNSLTSLTQKQNASFEDNSPVVLDSDFEVADRKTVIKAAELSQLVSGSLSKEDEERLVKERWAKRKYYVDEEEGLEKPDGADDSDDDSEVLANEEERDEGYAGPSAQNDESSHTVSRRASRVHFQDEVNHETWSQEPESTKLAREQWGGYEIPELEKDLGKEVLYQITQQAFNELLDPLFQAGEDMAMDAHALRSDRRKHAESIDTQLEKDRGWGTHNSAIFRTGIFRFVKCVVDVFCRHMNKPGVLEAISLHASKTDQEWYTSIITTAIEAAEKSVLKRVRPRKDDPPLDSIAEWNAELCKQQLYQEITTSALRLLTSPNDTTSREEPSGQEQHTMAQAVNPDPTMPQFRPNSTADMDASASLAVSEESQESASHYESEVDFEDFADDDGKIRIGPRGPFFVSVRHGPEEESSSKEEQGEDLTTASSTPPTGTSPPDNESHTSSSASSALPPAPTPSRNLSEEAPSTSETPSPRTKSSQFTNTPWLQSLSLHTSPSGVQSLSYTRRHVAHSTNLYAIAPEPDQTAALMANIRHSAKNPESPLYIKLLASCEAVEQQIRERKGSGLLSFDEFEAAMRNGKLRFLESWMDWLSV